MTAWFEQFALRASAAIGSAYAFSITCGLTLLWLVIGPFVGWSQYWQVTLTTAFTIATQLTAMLIQTTQNRQETAIQLKLDEIIRAIGPADNRLRGIEKVCDGGDPDEL